LSSSRPDAPAHPRRRRAAAWLLGVPLCAALALGSSCSHAAGDEPELAEERQRLSAGELVVDTSVRHQHITGFGASSAWVTQSLSDEMADLLFTPDKGIGLSLLRMHIYPDGTSTEHSTALSAYARGARVWAAPWSPPGAWKTSGTDNQGGSLLPEYYEAWADRLVAFAASMAEGGVPLVALSAQNEPNWVAEWETCVYTPEELKTFIRDYLGPALRRESPGTLLLAPESIDWITLPSYAGPLLEDPDTNAEVGIVAVHAYGGTPFSYAAPAEHGKEFWETEVSYDEGDDTALVTAREVHKHLVIGEVNAFHYWWLISETSAGLVKAGELTPQAYGLAHFSKFIRPGFVRVDMPATPRTGVFTSAYLEPESGRTVIVLVNETDVDLEWSFRIDGDALATVAPWVTSASENLAPQPPFAFSNPFGYTFAAKSITTLVLESSEPPDGGGGEGGAPGASGAPGEAGRDGDAAGAGQGGQGEGGAGVAGTSARAGSSGEGGEGGDASPPRGGTGAKGPGRAGESSHNGNTSGASAVPRRMPGAYTACSFGSGRAGGRGSFGALSLLAVSLFALRRRSSRLG
jgi:glucuronoarabinoxylan endo-1,4-beta-xylanase